MESELATSHGSDVILLHGIALCRDTFHDIAMLCAFILLHGIAMCGQVLHIPRSAITPVVVAPATDLYNQGSSESPPVAAASDT